MHTKERRKYETNFDEPLKASFQERARTYQFVLEHVVWSLYGDVSKRLHSKCGLAKGTDRFLPFLAIVHTLKVLAFDGLGLQTGSAA